MVGLLIFWDCHAIGSAECRPKTSVEVIDPMFSYNDYFYFRESVSGPLKRKELHQKGIKFIVQGKGEGTAFTLNALIFQASMGGALLGLSSGIVDFLMLCMFPKRQQYRELKYAYTEDFSDLEKKWEEEN